MEFLLVLVPLIIAISVVINIAKQIASHPFRCKHCSREFRIKWTRVPITEHSEKDYLLTCPHCGRKDWCTEQED